MLMKKAEVEEQNKELTSQINNSETQPEEKTSGFLNFIIIVVLLVVIFFMLENSQ